MAALLEDHGHTSQTSIFMNYVAIKESGLRRCRLVMSLVVLRSTTNIMSRSWYVSARDGQQIVGNFAGPNEFFLAE